MSEHLPADDPRLAFVLGIESGGLEYQARLLIRTLRHFGGSLASAPIIAVKTRPGPPLMHETTADLRELGVDLVLDVRRAGTSWYPYMTKAWAVETAARLSDARVLAWLDSDVLVCREPRLLAATEPGSLRICATDRNVGSTGPSDPNEAYWARLADVYGVSLDDLPWTTALLDGAKTRARLHSGVYAFDRVSGLASAFVEGCDRMLRCGVGYAPGLPFPGDDVALAFAAVLTGVRIEELPLAYNHEFTLATRFPIPERDESVVLHYHHDLEAPRADELLVRLRSIEPAVAELIAPYVPLPRRPSNPLTTLWRRVLAERRSRQAQWATSRLAFALEHRADT